MNIQKLNAYYFVLFHTLGALIPVYFTIFNKNINILLLTAFWWFLLIFSWLIFGKCVLVDIENNLLKNGYNNIWITEEIKKKNKIIAKIVSYMIKYLPILFITIVLIKIKYICKNAY